MKKAIPDNLKVAKDAKELIQECVSEYISFITSEASDKCLGEKRKTVNGDDLLWAMGTLGFDKYIEPLKIYLNKYRDCVKGDKPEKKLLAKLEKKRLKEENKLKNKDFGKSAKKIQKTTISTPFGENNGSSQHSYMPPPVLDFNNS